MLRALLLCAAARAVHGGKQGKRKYDIQFLDTLGGAHAFTGGIEDTLRQARAALAAREARARLGALTL